MTHSGIPVYKKKTYNKPLELQNQSKRHQLVIVGAGPIGLAAALDMALKGYDVLALTAFEFISAGSKGICYSKQTLDYFDRLGIGERVVEKGVIWNVGKVFSGVQKDPIYQFDMLPIKDQKNPGFVNTQQYYVEDYLCDALENMPNVDIRWGHSLSGLKTKQNGCQLQVSTKDGDYTLETEYLIACDGARSVVRTLMNLTFEGKVFEDNFLIADVKFKQKRPSERWFWFDPPFNPDKSALLHKQPDDVWRLDFQLGWDIDKAEAIKPKNVDPLIKGMLGDDIEYEEEWYSVYTFQCARMQRFIHGRVIFAGDSAHLVSPFGARGANGGFADADNLCWKLDLVLQNNAPEILLESYNQERVMGADENILNSTRSTDFITPKDPFSQSLRDAVLELSLDTDFAPAFINSGRLSMPTPYLGSVLSTEDRDIFHAGPAPGHPCIDAPIQSDNIWLLSSLGGEFMLLHFGQDAPQSQLKTLIFPTDGLAAVRYGADEGTSYLIRPDQVVAARWKSASFQDIEQALNKAMGKG